jgi:hypothetical protein
MTMVDAGAAVYLAFIRAYSAGATNCVATAQGAGIPPPSTAPTDHKGHAMGTRMARLPAKVR